MKRVTYLNLLSATLIVILGVGLVTAIQPSSGKEQKDFITLFVSICILAAIVLVVFEFSLKNKNSIWVRPVSERVGLVLINGVVISWLCLVALIFFMFLSVVENAPIVIATEVLVVIAAVGCGHCLQKRLANYSLLAYGISFLGALILMLGALFVLTIIGA